MQPINQISHHWQDPAHQDYTTGVSLHSHTSLSVETLSFIHGLCTAIPIVKPIVAFYERRAVRLRSLKLDFAAGNWRPPLVPRMAYDLEHQQIQQLGLNPLVSITDHDDIQAPMLLRNLPDARGIPVSLEWTVPFADTAFHMGIHNLPTAQAAEWMHRFEQFTAAPTEQELSTLLDELNAIPQVLIVLNHPQWDLHKIGKARHERELARFLRLHNYYIHALELNGLRHARENREVAQLAVRWRQLVISGGDRHGLEPNANINLTNATNFTEFVREIRVERKSHVLFMDQYARPWEQRILESTLEAISDHPHFSPGWQRWDERAFHPDIDGTMRPFSELWSNGRPPLVFRVLLNAVRLLGNQSLARAFCMALSRGTTVSTEEEAQQEVA